MSSTLSHFKKECEVSLETLLCKRASSRVQGRILWLFTGCGGKCGVPLEFQWGSQGPARVASEMSGLFSSCEGPIGTPLELLLVNRAVSRVQSGNSVLLSSGNWDLGLPIKVQLGNHASSGVEAWNSAFLSSCQRAFRPLVILFPFRRICRVPFEIQLVTQASSCGVRGSCDSSLVEVGNGPSSPDEVGHMGF